MIRVICKNCGFVEYVKRNIDFSSIRCNPCQSNAFGLKSYKDVREQDIGIENIFNPFLACWTKHRIL